MGWFVFDLAVLAVAVSAYLTAWFYGSLFADIRSHLEARGGLIGRLFACPLCLSFHVAFWLFWLAVFPSAFVHPAFRLLTGWFLYIPAAAYVGYRIYQFLEE